MMIDTSRLDPGEGRQIAALAVRSFLVLFVNGLGMLLFPLYFTALGYSSSMTGILVALTSLGNTAVSLAAAAAIERGDPRRSMMAGSVLIAVAFFAYTIVTSPAGITALRLIHGLLMPLPSVSGLVLLARIGGPRAGRVMGIVNQWGATGMILGPLAAGIIIEFVGPNGGFVIAGVITLISGLVVALAVPPGDRSPRPPGSNPAVKFRPQMYMLAGISMLDFLAYSAWTLVFTLWLRSADVSESTIGALLTVQMFAYAVVQRASGRLADAGLGPRAVIIGAAVSGVLMLVIPVFRSLYALGALMLVSGAIIGPVFTATFSGMRREAGDKTAQAMGMFQASIGLGNAIGPVMGGITHGISVLCGFGFTAAVYWLTAGLAWLYRRRMPRE